MLRRCLLLAVWLGCLTGAAHAQSSSLSVQQIMQRPAAWVGDWPENIRWHESGAALYFDWNPNGQFPSDSLYKVPRGGGEPVRVGAGERRAIPFFDGWKHGTHTYTADFRYKVYADAGDLYVYDRQRDAVQRLTQTRAEERAPRFSLDGTRVLFRRGDNLFALSRTSGLIVQRTDLRDGDAPKKPAPTPREQFLREQQTALFESIRTAQQNERQNKAAERREARADDPPPTFYTSGRSIQQLQLAPGGRFVTFAAVKDGPDGTTQMIDYVTETGFAEPLEARPKVGHGPDAFTLYVQDLQRDTTYVVNLHQLPGAYDVLPYRADDVSADSLKRTLVAFGPLWSGDGAHAVLEVRARDNKDRWIVALDAATGELTVLDRQHDAAWIAGPGISWWGGASTMGWLPDNERIFFQSEASGYSHLYTVNVETGTKRQLTSGAFEVFDPRLSQDGQTWYFASNEASPYERHLYRMPVDGGPRTRLTQKTGMYYGALSPTGDRWGLLYEVTNRPPEVYLKDNAARASAARITQSPTEQWLAYDWRRPAIIRFEASDGVQVPAQIFRPDSSNGAAVLFVHGAGYLQNVLRGWTHYFREYMFHNLLTDLGYTVMNVDYRGSAGYGRDWRTAIYRHMGGRDLQDYVDAQRYLQETAGIGPERTFIYGGSYGGFLTLMALFTEADHFGGGAALRSVTDWAHYNHPYTANILNTPQTDSLAYARSSPIYFADGLSDPLLMAHGLVDTNVQPQDIFRLSQRLIELQKRDWELAIYPEEAHGFEDPDAWTDEYRRILELIRRSVGPAAQR
ncbi:S9 family peptidase [Salisaeta longa]|uniref:S9 family peptidase n=1 Tax=Salisaeta longa TaxID=503170 RepID=UPI00040E86AE|nr:prolyl oligopeptidase family serine peptidase [Salisaeta longa]